MPESMVHKNEILRAIAKGGFVITKRSKVKLSEEVLKTCKFLFGEEKVQHAAGEVMLLKLSKEGEADEVNNHFEQLRGNLKTIFGSGKKDVVNPPMHMII